VILAAQGAVGITALAAQGPPPQPKPAPAAQAAAPKAGLGGAARPEGARSAHEVSRLKALLDAGEKAAENKDWDGAVARADEAEILVADWSEEQVRQPDVVALLLRLQDLEQHLPEADVPAAVPDPGLKESVEVVPLSEEERRAELAQVKNAEAGAVFDFPIDLNDKVLAWVHQFTTTKRGFMERTLTRATAYLPMVRQIFAEERIPQDLAYLAVIESGFINSAHSYAKAVGMWQFMRATGRIYGLNGNAWVEERRDPVKATRAAARYLRRLYETSGDWYLALVGYNAGPMTTERAIQNLGTRNFWDMHRSRWLRDQTKNYVPEMCAAVLVGRFPERYGLKIEQLPPYVYETVEVDRMTSLPVLARYAGADVEALRELNPELLRASTPPGRYVLRVPPGTSGVTARALARIPANQRLDFKTYKVKKGDTLARVAAKFKVGTEDLLAANDLTKAKFRPGLALKVPPPPPTPIDEKDLLPKADRAKVISDKPLETIPALPAVAPTVAAEAVAAAPVQEKTPAATGPARNDLPPTPPPALLEPAAPEPAAAKPQAKPAPQPRKVVEARPATHLVKRGETLFAISVRYGIEVNDLRKWNRMKTTRLQAGQTLRLSK
jgi:membrane-bound lytic murein transglycosylase D